MKPLSMILVAVAASAATSFAVLALRPDPAPAVSAAGDPDEVARLSRSVADVSERQAEIARTLADLRAEIAAAPRSEPRMPVGEIEAAVTRALEHRAASAPAPSAAPKAAASKGKLTAKGAFEALLAEDMTEERFQELWKEIVENGDVDAVLAMFEAHAEANPNDADAQVDLGRAYLQKLFTVGDGPQKGTYAIKADQSFDKALAIDEKNWGARFAKAISLSFWPPVFGKTGEAIKHFEILVQQQQGGATSPEFAQTHLLLGNLYLQQGAKDKAIAAWQQGLSLFPDNAQIQQQIANATSH